MRSTDASYGTGLWHATVRLPADVRRWVGRAIDSDWFRIQPGAYDGGREAGVCPFVAGAVMAGVWSNGGVLAGNPDWGTPSRPTPEIEDFAAYFDLFAEDFGTAAALSLIRAAVRATPNDTHLGCRLARLAAS